MNIRFKGTIGDHYEMFNHAVPWHDEFQSTIANSLSKNVSKDTPLFVEAGFGTGITTKTVLDRFPNSTVIAIDNVESMKSKAIEYLGNEIANKVDFRIGDLLDELKNISDNSVDAFYSGYVLHNISSSMRDEIIRNVFRILKPGGIYVNGDRIAIDDEKKQKDALSRAIVNCSIFFTKFNDPEYYLEWVRHYLRDEEPDLIFKAQNQIDLLNNTGFHSIQYVYKHDLEQTCLAIK